MGWTKRQIVEQAYEAIGFAFYDFDMTPEQMQTGLRMLDAMLATWNGRGIRLGYPLPSSVATGTLDQDADVPDYAVEAMYLQLALRIAPGAGKTVSPDTKNQAGAAYKSLMSRSTVPIEVSRDRLASPIGQGAKSYRDGNPYIAADPERIDAGPDSEIDFT